MTDFMICQFKPSSLATIREVPSENSAVLEKSIILFSQTAEIIGKLLSEGKLYTLCGGKAVLEPSS
jgi:hypothetical protein